MPYVRPASARRLQDNAIITQFFNTLKPRDKYLMIFTSHRSFFRDKIVVGVHIRHGNGEKGHFVNKSRQIIDLKAYLNQILTAVSKDERLSSEENWLFLATDSDIVINCAKEMFPRVITRDQWRPPVGSGNALHLGSCCPEGPIHNAANAMLDMFILGSCSLLAIVDDVTKWSWFAAVPARLIGVKNLIKFTEAHTA